MVRRDGYTKNGAERKRKRKDKKVRKPVRRESWPVRKVIESVTEEDRVKIDRIFENARKKEIHSAKGRKGFPPHALFLALMLMYLKGFDSIEDFVKFLKKNRKWLKRLGLKRNSKGKQKYIVPDPSTFSKFMKRYGKEAFPKVFLYFVAILADRGVIKGKHLSIDATIIKAWVKQAVKRSERKRKRRKYNDPDAAWGYCASKEIFIYGYKVHILIDVDTVLPIGILVTPANRDEGKQFSNVVKIVLDRFDFDVKKFFADAGYDYNWIRKMIITEIKATPYIDINPRNCKGNTKEEKKGRRKKLLKKWYRREFLFEYYVDPDSEEFDEEYDKRTFSEQGNSVGKGSLKLDKLKFKGIERATAHACLSLTGMLLVAITAEDVGRPDLRRCIKCFTT